MSGRVGPTRSPPRPRIHLTWSDPRFRAIIWQVLIVGAVVLIGWYLVDNTQRNLAARRIATGFGFLDRVAGIPIGEMLVPYDPAVNTYLRALVVGLLNTLKVAIVGVVLATILGTVIGIARLSGNWLLARLAAVYVEVLRDIPVLLQLLFWYTLLQGLPGPKQAIAAGGVFLSNRGIKLPVPFGDPVHGAMLLVGVAAVIAAMSVSGRATARRLATGVAPRIWPVVVGLVAGAPVLVWLLGGAPLAIDRPVLKGFNFQGGLTISPEFAALLIGLVIYTAAYIAEIVRAGILSVPRGQWEAAGALGLHRGTVLRRIVLPQALRVIIPPLTSQYLNITKNSSLAVAIGYQDIVSIANTTLNQTGQAIEGIAIIMAAYLTVSLGISATMNAYNSRIALVER